MRRSPVLRLSTGSMCAFPWRSDGLIFCTGIKIWLNTFDRTPNRHLGSVGLEEFKERWMEQNAKKFLLQQENC